ncbi:disulfide bond formation protein B [Leucothrix pacifica]|uniref:Disulfide bond formation protein B n=1 Tax=Leucothrix pacifica TaxID=1247513 RepID=A0A317CGK6_9GAMM|nr:disulfide bond formation protein B [Leucothrix pacifica]PWQ97704.1 disulfide bond formation protein B [Leucothrix pacifica]
MNAQPSIRLPFFIGFILCLLMLGFALFSQHYLGLEPCPLCIFQRVAVMALGLVFLLGALHNPATSFGRRAYGQLVILAALCGAAISGRHSWLQHLPPEKVPECGPGLSYWLDNLPITSVFNKVFAGSGECAEVEWSLFGLSMPEWVLITFVVFALYGLKVLIKGR